MSGVRLSATISPRMPKRTGDASSSSPANPRSRFPSEMIHYGMTKTAQLAIARGLAESVAGTGITVNSVLPGPTALRRRCRPSLQSMAARKANQTPRNREGILHHRPPLIASYSVSPQPKK